MSMPISIKTRISGLSCGVLTIVPHVVLLGRHVFQFLLNYFCNISLRELKKIQILRKHEIDITKQRKIIQKNHKKKSNIISNNENRCLKKKAFRQCGTGVASDIKY